MPCGRSQRKRDYGWETPFWQISHVFAFDVAEPGLTPIGSIRQDTRPGSPGYGYRGFQPTLEAVGIRGVVDFLAPKWESLRGNLFPQSSIGLGRHESRVMRFRTGSARPLAVSDCCFNGSSMQVEFKEIHVKCCSFVGCNFIHSSISAVVFEDCWFDRATFDSGSYLAGVHFRNCSLLGMDFSRAMLASFGARDCRIDSSFDQFEEAPSEMARKDAPGVRLFHGES